MIAIPLAFFEFIAAFALLNHGAQFAAGLALAFSLSIIFIELGSMWRRTCTPFS